MKPDSKKLENKNIYSSDDTDLTAVASATECTGLMFAPPESEDEGESYADIYNVPPESIDGDGKVKEH